MHQGKITLLLLCLCTIQSIAQVAVSANKKYLVEKDGRPFFWLGDTDWEMAHRLDRDEFHTTRSGIDWVLVVDDASRGFGEPGKSL